MSVELALCQRRNFIPRHWGNVAAAKVGDGNPAVAALTCRDGNGSGQNVAHAGNQRGVVHLRGLT